MKKKTLILFAIISIFSFCVFTGLFVYAFRLQSKTNQQDNMTQEEPDTSSQKASASNESNSDTSTDTSSKEQETMDVLPSVIPDKEQELHASITPTPVQNTVKDTDPEEAEPIVLAFAGDVNLDESSKPVAKYDSVNKGILGVLSEDLVNEMTSADIMMLNNEFAYSTRGTKTPDKSYTFRADPSRVSILCEMGVDIVSLANNHALDYGPDALADTFITLDNAEIDYVGAGDNMNRAKAPIYKKVGNKTIAFVSASRVVFAMDWYATDTRLGMVGTYDPTLILESVKEAEANSDFVVIFVHWGVERTHKPEDYQKKFAKQYIDAGADAVIGSHPHVMQGFEYYKGKPIAYSLGNFWFNGSTKESGLVKLTIDSEDNVSLQLLPVMNKDTYTYMITDEEEKKNYFNFIQEISFDVTIDENGFIVAAD